MGNFAFTAAEAGDYSACFYVPDLRPPRTLVIDFDWRTGVAARDWSSVAKKGNIEVKIKTHSANFSSVLFTVLLTD